MFVLLSTLCFFQIATSQLCNNSSIISPVLLSTVSITSKIILTSYNDTFIINQTPGCGVIALSDDEKEAVVACSTLGYVYWNVASSTNPFVYHITEGGPPRILQNF